MPRCLADLEIVVADGFTDFTHTQLEILGAARAARRPTVRLAAGRREAARAAASELFAKSTATLAELRPLVIRN